MTSLYIKYVYYIIFMEDKELMESNTPRLVSLNATNPKQKK